MPPERLHRLLAAHPAAGVPDVELVRRFAEQYDHAAFELLVRRHAAAVWRVCRPVAGSHHAAEDAFQSTFLALARKAGSLRANVVGWLCRVAYHAALKARRRTPTLPDRFDTAAPDAPPQDDTAPLLHAELNRLADKYRLPLVLCYLHGLTQAEAAAKLGWPLGTVATRVKRGCDALRARLTKRGVAFTAALFGAGTATEATVAGTVRLIEPGASVPLPLTRLTTEVLRVTTPKLPRVVVLIACGLLGVGGAVGLWSGGSPVAPPATAAPVPALAADKRKELDDAWNGLSADPKTQTRAVVRLAADPKATTAYLKERFRPVTVSEEAVKKTLADLEGDDEKTWRAAYRSVQYHDPRLAMSVPDVWAAVKTNAGRHRLYHALMTDTPADHPTVRVMTYHTYDDPVEDGTYPGFFRVASRPTADAPKDVARVEQVHMVQGKPENFYRPEWERADRLITLLEVFGTPDAVAVLKDVAAGHPDAIPTKSAKEALGRLKK